MKRNATFRAAALLSTVVAALACNKSFVDPDVVPYANASLSIAPGATGASGSGNAQFDRPEDTELRYLNYIVTLTNVTGITAMHLHQNSSATPLVTLYDGAPTPTINGEFMNANFGQSEMAPTMTLDELRNLISSGQIYLDIHTEANPNGELRGTLTLP